MTFNLNENFFQKNLQFRDIWPQNRQKNAQIEAFRRFLDFVSLVFHFVHNELTLPSFIKFLHLNPFQQSVAFHWFLHEMQRWDKMGSDNVP